jgi:hypothetical protein
MPEFDDYINAQAIACRAILDLKPTNTAALDAMFEWGNIGKALSIEAEQERIIKLIEPVLEKALFVPIRTNEVRALMEQIQGGK